MRKVVVLLTAIVILWAGIAAALADRRVALVIGNSDYAKVNTLPNTLNDAGDVAAKLEKLNFSVTRLNDLGFDAMRRALRAFGDSAAGADIALFYFAGHGMEVNRQNYLVPVDATLGSDRDIEFETIPLDLVMAAVEQAKGLRLVLLDACRNNPFANAMKVTSASRSIGRGLSRVEPETGTLVSFAAREGTVAADGDGRNSPYTAALLANLGKPSLEVNLLFRKVRDDVIANTNGAQVPFTYGSLPATQFFLSVTGPAEVTIKTPGTDPKPDNAVATAIETTFWTSIVASTNPADFKAYLAQYPQGSFAALARNRLQALKDAAEGAAAAEQAASQAAAELAARQAAAERAAAEEAARQAATLAAAQQLANLETSKARQIYETPRPGYSGWMTGAQYQADFNAHAQRHLYPIYVEGVSLDGTRFFRVRYKPLPKSVRWFEARHGLSQAQYAERNAALAAQGYRQLFRQEFSASHDTFVQAMWIK
jgi:uncharacterized caspase-like protein